MNVFVFAKHYPTPPKTGTADGATDATGDAVQIGQAKTGRATRRPSEPRRAAQDAAEGTATTADADGAQRGTESRRRGERYHINMEWHRRRGGDIVRRF